MNQTTTYNIRRKPVITGVVLLLMAVSSLAFISSQPKLLLPVQKHQLKPIELKSKFLKSTQNSFRRRHFHATRIVLMKSAISDTDMEAEINKMRAKEIRDELESYGISTKSFFEKSELAEALLAARKEGKTPIKDVNGASSAYDRASSTNTSTSSSSGDRQKRIQQEMEKCKSMKVSDLKKELESYGLSTKSYFEKSEFVKAVAEARVDGVTKQSVGSSGSSGRQQKEEPRDPSYRDVVVSKFTGDRKLLLDGKVFDVKAR